MTATINTISTIFLIILGISLLFLLNKIIYYILAFFPQKKLPKAKANHKYAILIPARNESAVIEGLLKSIKEQEYPAECMDVFVVVESEDDPTVEIAKQFGYNVFVREHLELKGKGYALDEVIKHIKYDYADREYEAYYVFDADNILSYNYFTEMNKAFDAGYEIALGYRNSKNWNDGWIASCSALTFSTINTCQNKGRNFFRDAVLVSGTGFFISTRVMSAFEGWPFVTMTEDLECSLYCVRTDVRGRYVETAEFYDEQPNDSHVSWKQRLRWLKGFNQNADNNFAVLKSAFTSKTNRFNKFEFGVNIFPIAVFLSNILLYIILMFTFGVVGLVFGLAGTTTAFLYCGICLLSFYAFFALYFAGIVIAESKKINLTFGNKFKTIIMAPIYTAAFIPIFIQSLASKEVEWVPIEHKHTEIQ